MARHAGTDALGARDLARIADLAHAPVEQLHREQELVALGLLAADAIFAPQDRDVERPFAAQLAVNLEPVYAILLAVVFLGEARELNGLFFLGVLIVLAAVFGHGWVASRVNKPLTDEPPSV